MAKKRAKPKMTKAKPNAIVIRGSQEWWEWLKEAADHERTTVAEFADRAFAARAKANGFKREPPKR